MTKACEDCGNPFEGPARKRFCSEGCQRNAERRRYRARHTEEATCKDCGRTFKRDSRTPHRKVYCSLRCQYRHRSVEYLARADIREQMDKARAARGKRHT